MNTSHYATDEQLLSSMQKGDKRAFDTLFRRYYPLLCAYTNRFVSLEDSEEIVQDVMLWLWENRQTHVINVSFHRYLLKTVYHRGLNKIERNDAQYRADTRFYKQMQAMLEDTDYYLIEELKQKIEAAVQQLPPSYREAFVMHRFRNLSYKEIADILSVSPKTVDYRIQQALKKLRTELKDYMPMILPLLICGWE